jgi:hypothetical protein
MVRHLLPLVAGALASWGCVLSNPPDFEEGGGHSPVITQYAPGLAHNQIDTESGRTTKFRAWVRDEDRGDHVWFRWYLDYLPDSPACACMWWGQAPRQGEADYLVEWGLYNGLPALSAGKCHRLTVVVSDGPWLDELDEECGCPQVVDGANRVAHDWWIGAFSESNRFDDIPYRDCFALDQQNPLAELPEEVDP